MAPLLFVRQLWAEDCEITVQLVDGYPPISFTDDNGKWLGTDIAYIDMLMAEAGCSYKLVSAPLGRGVKMVERGVIDMALDISRLPEREKGLYFVGPQRMETILLVSRVGSIPTVSSWEDMRKLKANLVRQRGAYYGDELEFALKQNPQLAAAILAIADNEAIVDIVNKGRADGFFVESSYWHYMKATNPAFANLELHPLVINAEPVYFAFSKESVSPEFLERISRAYERIKQSDKYMTIEKDYIKYLSGIAR